jgi:hypothetical protein
MTDTDGEKLVMDGIRGINVSIRSHVATVLLADTDTDELQSKWLAHQDQLVKAAAAQALGGRPLVPSQIDALVSDADLTVRFATLRSVAKFDDGFERAAATALMSAPTIWTCTHCGKPQPMAECDCRSCSRGSRSDMAEELKTRRQKRARSMAEQVPCVERGKRVEFERRHRFRCEELFAPDKASLDIFSLSDESLEDTDNLPAPGVIAAEIVEDLTAALEKFTVLAESLQGIGDLGLTRVSQRPPYRLGGLVERLGSGGEVSPGEVEVGFGGDRDRVAVNVRHHEFSSEGNALGSTAPPLPRADRVLGLGDHASPRRTEFAESCTTLLAE